jgi:hypothetical protein
MDRSSPEGKKTVKKVPKDKSGGYSTGWPGGKSNDLCPDDLQAVVIGNYENSLRHPIMRSYPNSSFREGSWEGLLNIHALRPS